MWLQEEKMAERSMIKRVARELCRSDGHPENIRYEGKAMWASYADLAGNVLTAMREPTEAMLETGNCTAEQWSRMIDAAMRPVDWSERT
jgi:hypothetical protein